MWVDQSVKNVCYLSKCPPRLGGSSATAAAGTTRLPAVVVVVVVVVVFLWTPRHALTTHSSLVCGGGHHRDGCGVVAAAVVAPLQIEVLEKKHTHARDWSNPDVRDEARAAAIEACRVHFMRNRRLC